MSLLRARFVRLVLPAILVLLSFTSTAEAIVLVFEINTTKALAGNLLGAVIETGAAAGSGNTGTTEPNDVGEHLIPLRASESGAGASMTLHIGTKTFVESDDIQWLLENNVPAAGFEDGEFVELDLALLFEVVAGEPLTKAFNPYDLAQDTSSFLNTPHYWIDFEGDNIGFALGLVTGFEAVSDPEEGVIVLQPVFAQGTLVEGNLQLASNPVPVFPLSGFALLSALLLWTGSRASRTQAALGGLTAPTYSACP